MAHLRSRSAPRFAKLVALPVAGLVLAGCFTGPRPDFEDDQAVPVAMSGNEEIDHVLGLLDSVDDAEFTVGYTIETNFNTVSSTGLVVQAAGARRSITVENDNRTVRFVEDAGDQVTCDLLTGACEASLNDARISDTQLPHDFYGPAFASRLRADANRRIGDPVAYVQNLAGQTADCVDVPVNGGLKTYCALASGPLAKFVGADATIELTSYSPQPDLSKLQTS